jgi:hypothetical protein
MWRWWALLALCASAQAQIVFVRNQARRTVRKAEIVHRYRPER